MTSKTYLQEECVVWMCPFHGPVGYGRLLKNSDFFSRCLIRTWFHPTKSIKKMYVWALMNFRFFSKNFGNYKFSICLFFLNCGGIFYECYCTAGKKSDGISCSTAIPLGRVITIKKWQEKLTGWVCRLNVPILRPGGIPWNVQKQWFFLPQPD